MKTAYHVIKFVFITALLVNLIGIAPSSALAQEENGQTSLKDLLNPDGTLRLDGSFSGSLDLEGYTISLDPKKGPVLKPQAGGAEGDWEALNYGPGMVGAQVYAIAVAVDGVYVGGNFGQINNTPNTAFLAKWTGSAWEGVGHSQSLYSLNNTVRAIALWGGYVYVGGDFTNVTNGLTVIPEADYVARWDGTNWTSLYSNGSGNGSLNNKVHALNIDENYLYVGGEFTDVNNGGATLNAADYFALYNLGSDEWEALGSDNSGNGSFNNAVVAIDVNDYGVYAGGFFTDVKNPGGTLANADYIARWNGGAWEALSSNGAGDGSLNFPVFSLAHTGVGTNTLVYVGGQFTDVKYGSTTLSNADFIARWEPDSAAWETIPGAPALNGYVYDIFISGSSILLGGSFTNAAGIPEADYAALWNGSAWTALGSDGTGDGSLDLPVLSVAIQDGMNYVGGHFAVEFNNSPMPDANYFAIWDGSAWSSAGGYNGSILASAMYSIAASEGQVYFGGYITNFYNNGMYNSNGDSIFLWDGNGASWNNVGAGNFEQGNIYDIVINGSDIYVAGSFQNGAGIPEADYIAKWNGSVWSALGSDGMGDGALKDIVHTLLIYGSDVYAGGNFLDAAGIPAADHIAKWNGAAWSAVGSVSAINASVLALEEIGGTLYAGGMFQDAGGAVEADYLAKFDGANWSAVGNNPLILGGVHTLAAQNNDLYAGGAFIVSGIPNAVNIAKFDGANWSAMGAGLPAPVNSIAVAGTDIYAGGIFKNAGGIPEADYIAKWDGANWSALGSNGAGGGSLNGWVEAVEIANGRVYAAGSFVNVNNNGTILNAADYVAAFVVDATAPTISSITRANPSPTSAASVDFTVAFSEAVSGVDTADFSLTKTGGVSGESITSVSGAGMLYTVTVNTGSGNGTLRLDVPVSATIQDMHGLNISGLPFTSGESYVIEKNNAPTDIILSSATITENLPAGTSIGSLSSADPNAGDTFTYALVSGAGGADNAAFTISGNTLNSAQPFNFLNKNSYSIRIRSTDGGGLFTEKAFTVTITDTPPIFADVPDSYWAVSFIERLYNAGITGGCTTSPLNYCPDNNVTRAQMAVFLEKALHGSGFTPPNVPATFTDTSGHWAEDWIEALKADAITSGCAAGFYCPENSVTRAQMAVFLLKATHGASYSPPPATGTFGDVSTDYWAAAWIEQLAVEGITSGCAAGLYCPESPVTRAQMAVFLVKAFNLP